MSPPTIAAATLVAGATTAAASQLTESAPTVSAGHSIQASQPMRDRALAGARASRSTTRSARVTSAARLAQLMRPVTVPQALLSSRQVDSAATRAAKSELTSARATYDRTRAALLTARAEAERAEAEWAKVAGDHTSPSLEEARKGLTAVAREAMTHGASGVAASVAGPALEGQKATSAAYQARLAAEKRLRAAADAHAASVKSLTTLRDQAQRLDAADTRRGLAEGILVRLKDGRAVPTIKVGTPVVGNGWSVTPKVSAWIGEALDELYRSGHPRGPHDAEDLAIVIFNESGGDPGSVNTWDTNAAAGIPSFGLMQTIGPTFEAHALPTRRDPKDPVAQICAGARYGTARYGSLSDIPGVKSLRSGGPYRPY
ncbi:transglycosylase SLT domain-containing protein [Arsenicicoccus dermatophilus]|uniref:transglycosylase SLT domain-containing protein n=1 Tax=Arsenicicoccus dermatophilus TaxID=1076331 RepID=UPI001F4CC2DF|nr:transglycosylase SLT domain-containing protein [Arsenicicoccus dermatophilus]